MGIAIFTHGDTDGICSGAMVLSKYPGARVWITNPVGLLKDLKACNEEEVFILDIALSERDREEIFRELGRLSRGKVTYIDHHPLPAGIMSGAIPCTRAIIEQNCSASELVYHLLKEKIPHEMNRVALFGAISDYCDETDLVKNELDTYDKRTIYLEAGLLSQCLGESKGDYAFKKEIINKLSRGILPSSVDRVVKKALGATKKEWRLHKFVVNNAIVHNGIAVVNDIPRGISPTKAAKFAVGTKGRPIGLGIKKRNDHVDISVRKERGFHLDLNRTLRIIASRYNGSGGGHPAAAGARIPMEHLEDFIETLAREVS